MQHLIALTWGLRRWQYWIRIPVAARKYLLWWAQFAARFNGMSHWHSHAALPDHVVATDSSLSGGAAVHAGDYLYTSWQCDDLALSGASINILEMFTILLVPRHWGSDGWESLVHLYTGSNVALYIIRSHGHWYWYGHTCNMGDTFDSWYI